MTRGDEQGHGERRAAVRHVLRTKRIGTQEELRRELVRRGFVVTQATLSRDLARLKARRVSLPEGGSVYEVDGVGAAGEHELALVAGLVTGVDDNETLVVVHTTPGGAPVVAAALDRARLPAVLGCIAGDDTIFIAPARGAPVAALRGHFNTIWKKGEG